MYIRLGRLSINLAVLLIGLSYFIVLFNPLGWHMFIHTMPLYLILIIVYKKEKVNRDYKNQVFIMFLFILYVMISAGSRSFEYGTVGKIIRYLYEFLIFSVFVTYYFSPEKMRLLLRIYIVSCLGICLKMLLQQEHLETDSHRYSILNGGKLMDPNYLAALFILPIIIIFYKCIKKDIKIKSIILLLIFCGAVLATGSRGAFVSIALGCCYIYIKENTDMKRMILGILVLIILFTVVFMLLPSEVLERFDYHNFRDGSNKLRINLWETALRIFCSNPIFGRGANSMINLGMSYGARVNLIVHNSYLEILADYGLVGFALWITPFVTVFFKAVKEKNNLIVGILSATYACAFFISAQHSAFLWQNVLICYSLLRFNKNILLDDQESRIVYNE